MGGAKIFFHLTFENMHRRRDDVARRLTAKLDDVFAKVRLDGLNAVLFQMVVDADFLGNH